MVNWWMHTFQSKSCLFRREKFYFPIKKFITYPFPWFLWNQDKNCSKSWWKASFDIKLILVIRELKNLTVEKLFLQLEWCFHAKQNLWRTSLVLKSTHSFLTVCDLLWNIQIFLMKVSWVSSLDLGWPYPPFPFPYTLKSYISTFIRHHSWSSPSGNYIPLLRNPWICFSFLCFQVEMLQLAFWPNTVLCVFALWKQDCFSGDFALSNWLSLWLKKHS